MVNVTSSIKNNFSYCLINAFLGSVKIERKVSLSNGSMWVNTGKRPIISGINPKSLMSFGIMYCNKLSLSILSTFLEVAYPTAVLFNRLEMILSIPSNAPPAMKRMFCVFTSTNFWSGCFLPPFGGTFTTVPSNNFNNACCTPSPETSRVIEGLSLLRAILSISSINTMPRSALATS